PIVDRGTSPAKVPVSERPSVAKLADNNTGTSSNPPVLKAEQAAPNPQYEFTFQFRNKSQFYGALVELSKMLRSEVKRIEEILTKRLGDLQSKEAVRKELKSKIESVRMTAAKAVAMIQYGTKEIVKDASQAKLLQTGGEGLQSAITSMVA